MVDDKKASFGIVDRELKNIKFRFSEFPGLRVSAADLVINQAAGPVTKPSKTNFSKMRGRMNSQGNQKNKGLLASMNEVMRNAVADYLKKKKESVATVTGGVPEPVSPVLSPSSSIRNSESAHEKRSPRRRPTSLVV